GDAGRGTDILDVVDAAAGAVERAADAGNRRRGRGRSLGAGKNRADADAGNEQHRSDEGYGSLPAEPEYAPTRVNAMRASVASGSGTIFPEHVPPRMLTCSTGHLQTSPTWPL